MLVGSTIAKSSGSGPQMPGARHLARVGHKASQSGRGFPWFLGYLLARAVHAPRSPREALTPMTQDQVVVIKDEASNLLLTYVPVEVPVPRQGGLELTQPLAEMDRYTTDSLRNEMIGSVTAVVVAAALALFLGVVFIGRPISRLAAKARRVGTGDLSGPLHLAQRDELGELATEINVMCERLADERNAREGATEPLRH